MQLPPEPFPSGLEHLGAAASQALPQWVRTPEPARLQHSLHFLPLPHHTSQQLSFLGLQRVKHRGIAQVWARSRNLKHRFLSARQEGLSREGLVSDRRDPMG